MYSTEPQKSSISNVNMQVDNNSVSEIVSEGEGSAAIQQNNDVKKPMHSFNEPTLNKAELKADAIERQMQTIEKRQKEIVAEWKNADRHTLEQRSAVVGEEPQKDSVTSPGPHSGIAKQEADQNTWKLPSLQEVSAKKNEKPAGYVAV